MKIQTDENSTKYHFQNRSLDMKVFKSIFPQFNASLTYQARFNEGALIIDDIK